MCVCLRFLYIFIAHLFVFLFNYAAYIFLIGCSVYFLPCGSAIPLLLALLYYYFFFLLEVLCCYVAASLVISKDAIDIDRQMLAAVFSSERILPRAVNLPNFTCTVWFIVQAVYFWLGDCLPKIGDEYKNVHDA